MNKKVLIIIVVLAIIIIGITIGIFFYANNESNNNVDYVIIGNEYSSYESKIISTYQEYIEFVNYINSVNNRYGKIYDFNSNKYNEEYFNNKSLAIINIITGSGMNKLNNIDISIKDNLLVCKVDIDYARGISTADINGKLLLIEINKSVTKFQIKR